MIQIWVVAFATIPSPEFSRRFGRIFVAVMFVVRVSVFVFKRCVKMFVSVFFGQMQVNAEAHQNGGGDKCQTD